MGSTTTKRSSRDRSRRRRRRSISGCTSWESRTERDSPVGPSRPSTAVADGQSKNELSPDLDIRAEPRYHLSRTRGRDRRRGMGEEAVREEKEKEEVEE